MTRDALTTAETVASAAAVKSDKLQELVAALRQDLLHAQDTAALEAEAARTDRCTIELTEGRHLVLELQQTGSVQLLELVSHPHALLQLAYKLLSTLIVTVSASVYLVYLFTTHTA
jgi:hypothetical protein